MNHLCRLCEGREEGEEERKGGGMPIRYISHDQLYSPVQQYRHPNRLYLKCLPEEGRQIGHDGLMKGSVVT